MRAEDCRPRRGNPEAAQTSGWATAVTTQRTPPCSCCGGTGVIDPDRRPLCATAIGRRDTRSSAQLRTFAALQRLALAGIAYDRDGQLLPEHDEPYVDYTTGDVRI